MKERLATKHGTSVVPKEVEDKPDFGAYFMAGRREIALDTHETDIHQYVLLSHEAVHSRTEHFLRTDPTNDQAVLAMTVSREGIPIDARLPKEYENFYSADEMKAYRKTSILISKIATLRKINKQLTRAKRNQKLADEEKNKSQDFAAVTHRIFSEVRTQVLEAIGGQSIDVWIEPYSKDLKNIFTVKITLPQPIGPPVVAHLLLYDATAIGNRISDLNRKILTLCDTGLRLSAAYLK